MFVTLTKKRLNRILLTGILFFCVVVQVYSSRELNVEAINKVKEVLLNTGLIAKADYPSLSEIIAAFEGQIPDWIFNDDTEYWVQSVSDGKNNRNPKGEFIEVAAHSVSCLEKAFPGATWGPMGRDSALFGYILEAVYEAMGQSGRVKLIRGSNATFSVKDTYLDDLAEYLEHQGMDTSEKPTPLIFLDSSNVQDSSQSISIMRAAYRHYQKLGFNARDLLHIVNFVNLRENESNPREVFQDEGLKRFFEQELDVTGRRFNMESHVGYQMPSEFLALGGLTNANTALYTYSIAWHGGWLYLVRNDVGEMSAPIKGGYEDSDYRSILVMTALYFLKWAGSPEFKLRLTERAAELGYVFPFGERQVSYEIRQPTPEELAQLEKERKEREAQAAIEREAHFMEMVKVLKTLIAEAPVRSDEKQRYLSSQAEELRHWFVNNAHEIGRNGVDSLELNTSRLAFVFIEALVFAFRDNKIGTRDLRRLIAMIVVEIDWSKKEATTLLTKLVSEHKELQEVFVEKAWRFYDPNTRDHENVGEVFNSIRERVLEPMGCQLKLSKPIDEKRAS